LIDSLIDWQEVGGRLSVQALNVTNVPMAVEKCINFIALHGNIFFVIIFALMIRLSFPHCINLS